MQFNNIKKIRESKQMSQEELATAAGVSRTLISGLETQKITNITAKTLIKIANALEVDLIELFNFF